MRPACLHARAHFIVRRPASDRMQAVFITWDSATTDSELKRSGRELNRIYEFAKI